MHNRQAITLSALWDSLCDYDLWPIYLLGLIVYTPMVPIRTYITLTLKSVGFDTVLPPALPAFEKLLMEDMAVQHKSPHNPLQHHTYPPPKPPNASL